MRGDHFLSIDCARSIAGTSPHARGPPCSFGIDIRDCGNIPACAGTTRAGASPCPTSREHPRMRGDHPSARRRRVLSRGTSPHARGPRLATSLPSHHGGNIPACAGTTEHADVDAVVVGEHPRMRGDHIVTTVIPMLTEGTSPHARGPLPLHHRVDLVVGNIPACAGTTGDHGAVGVLHGEHPRMRGDHMGFVYLIGAFLGTSPHARGPLLTPHHPSTATGNIPACAGTTATPI